MSSLAFATCAPVARAPAPLRRRAATPAATPAAPPRAAMRSDSLAPEIRIVDTKSDGTSSVSVAMRAVAAWDAQAPAVAGNASLAASLRTRTAPVASPAGARCPPGVAPKDFYFPPAVRNLAPVIDLGPTSLAVSYDPINPVVGGVAANSSGSVAFWKQTQHKYVAPDAPEVVPGAEVISTELFERYFPTKIRNRAPKIEMRPPKYPGDRNAFFKLESELVTLNTVLASKLDLPRDDEEPTVAGAIATAKYFPAGRINIAPVIDMVEEESLTLEMTKIAAPQDLAATLTGRSPPEKRAKPQKQAPQKSKKKSRK